MDKRKVANARGVSFAFLEIVRYTRQLILLSLFLFGVVLNVLSQVCLVEIFLFAVSFCSFLVLVVNSFKSIKISKALSFLFHFCK